MAWDGQNHTRGCDSPQLAIARHPHACCTRAHVRNVRHANKSSCAARSGRGGSHRESIALTRQANYSVSRAPRWAKYAPTFDHSVAQTVGKSRRCPCRRARRRLRPGRERPQDSRAVARIGPVGGRRRSRFRLSHDARHVPEICEVRTAALVTSKTTDRLYVSWTFPFSRLVERAWEGHLGTFKFPPATPSETMHYLTNCHSRTWASSPHDTSMEGSLGCHATQLTSCECASAATAAKCHSLPAGANTRTQLSPAQSPRSISLRASTGSQSYDSQQRELGALALERAPEVNTSTHPTRSLGSLRRTTTR